MAIFNALVTKGEGKYWGVCLWLNFWIKSSILPLLVTTDRKSRVEYGFIKTLQLNAVLVLLLIQSRVCLLSCLCLFFCNSIVVAWELRTSNTEAFLISTPWSQRLENYYNRR